YLMAQVQDLARADARYNAKLIRFLAFHLTPYVAQGRFKTKREYVHHLNQLEIRTLRGEKVRSQEEAAIANYLAINGVEYAYEAYYKRETATALHSQYRPDFYLPEEDLYLEHFAIDEHGKTPPFIDQQQYSEGIKWKRDLHNQYGTRLIETYSHEFRDGSVFEALETRLRDAGVTLNPISLAELLAQTADQKADAHPFAKLVGNFVNLLKSSAKDWASLRGAARVAEDGGRSLAFLDLVEPVFTRYNATMRAQNEVDFNDMINEAARALDAGQYRSPYLYILVDEFQDISLSRANMLRALLRSRPEAGVFCVGDDWQAIFRFTGSDISLTSAFDQQFGQARTVALDLTFRFNDKISAFASAFVMKNEAQVKKTIRTLTRAEGPAVTLVQHGKDSNEAAIETCLAAIGARAEAGATVYMLGRYGFNQPKLFSEFQRRHPKLRLEYHTAHGSKGKEADYALVLDVSEGKHGFPSLMDDDPLLSLVLPTREAFPHAEERRLFYVAVTRARHHTYILAPIHAPSVFVREMLEKQGTDYEFEHLVTAQASKDLAASAPCPTCDGRLLPRASKGGEPYYQCTSQPYCEERANVCETCRRAPMVRQQQGHRCADAACGAQAQTCPRCGIGQLTLRSGRKGAFWGCSNYQRGLCGYTQNGAASR
ncbi:MAG: UvrD-helicase domain-containing protein, partial [Candidatus Sericytochromatia bacterium]|nr:UvrD-helicase domain-containing protein [Candidatus Sericytochromatia bacterium]